MNAKKLLIPVLLILMLASPVGILAKASYAMGESLESVYTQAGSSVTTSTGEPFYGDYDEGEGTSRATLALSEILDQGQSIFNGLIGIGLLSSVAAFAFTAFKLGKSGDARGRAEAINTLIAICITTACLGGFPLIYAMVVSVIA